MGPSSVAHGTYRKKGSRASGYLGSKVLGSCRPMPEPTTPSLFDFLHRELEKLESFGLRRSPRTFATGQGPTIEADGTRRINFSSNDYLGLAHDPAVACAAAEAARVWGAGTGASRLVSGSFDLHEQLEARLCELKHTDAALVYATGSMANMGAIPRRSSGSATSCT